MSASGGEETRVATELSSIAERMRSRFEAQKRVLSFGEYLGLFHQRPWRHSRDAAGYLRDCFDHFGTYDVMRASGSTRRFRLFDAPFEDSRTEERPEKHEFLLGQEDVQNAVYRIVQNFVREGRPNRLVLLHGPNGSAKSTFVSCIMRGLQAYSNVDEGALYRFSWIFPRGTDGKRLGFSDNQRDHRPGETFAHLPEERIDVKLQSQLREHPLLLLPAAERARMVRDAYREAGVEENPPDWVLHGELSQKNRLIFEALLTAYRGDLERVYAHVQVERYYFSRRYRVGAVTIGPQMAVDASERQITADRTLGSLPASLSALTLFEPYGELVDAAGGVVEYSDLLKRPLDAWKYLLLAIENGEISLPLSNLATNSVLMATSNELHLEAFQEHPEYGSFRGRIQRVRVPYLLNYQQEQGIYDAQIVPQVRRHVAPHAIYVAALWAVLTRLRRPKADQFDRALLGRVAVDLSPLEKAELYATGELPGRLSSEEAKELKNGIAQVQREGGLGAAYEGRIGISPREVRNLLLDAAQDPEEECLSPTAVLSRIEEFAERDDYAFLKQKPDGGYHDQVAYLRIVRQRWLERVDAEFRGCSGLVDEAQYEELFERYVTHVSYWLKREKLYNEVTGKYEDADEDLMSSTEDKLGVAEDTRESFRRDLISVVAAQAIDNPDDAVDYPRLFPRYLQNLREAYFAENKKRLTQILEAALQMLSEQSRPGHTRDDGRSAPLDAAVSQAATLMRERMEKQHGYQASSLRNALSELLRSHYRS